MKLYAMLHLDLTKIINHQLAAAHHLPTFDDQREEQGHLFKFNGRVVDPFRI
jgi:hypothetical protein